MDLQSIAVHFADQLGRHRVLTSMESDMLIAIVEKRRRDWTADDLARLQTARKARKLAPQIARELGRSPGAVRSMVRNLKRKERACG